MYWHKILLQTEPRSTLLPFFHVIGHVDIWESCQQSLNSYCKYVYQKYRNLARIHTHKVFRFIIHTTEHPGNWAQTKGLSPCTHSKLSMFHSHWLDPKMLPVTPLKCSFVLRGVQERDLQGLIAYPNKRCKFPSDVISLSPQQLPLAFPGV